MTVRVLIADDQELVREGIRTIIDAQDDLEVVGEAGHGRDAVRLARHLRPDIVLMDIRMPEVDGIEATRLLLARQEHPTKVLILTTFDDDEYVYEALRAGASGFLLKDVPRRQLLEAIRSVFEGDLLLASAITRRLVEQHVSRPAAAPDDVRLARLTPREREVLALVALGRANAEIAAAVHLSESTIKTYVGQLLQKLALRDRVHLVIYAYETGLVRPGD